MIKDCTTCRGCSDYNYMRQCGQSYTYWEPKEMKISPELVSAIHSVWADIAPDAMEFCCDNDEAIELCIDADRLVAFGHAEAAKEFKELYSEHGIVHVMAELNERIKLL